MESVLSTWLLKFALKATIGTCEVLLLQLRVLARMWQYDKRVRYNSTYCKYCKKGNLLFHRSVFFVFTLAIWADFLLSRDVKWLKLDYDTAI